MDGEEVRLFGNGGASEEALGRAAVAAPRKMSVADSRVQL